jgi:hypothetical protein
VARHLNLSHISLNSTNHVARHLKGQCQEILCFWFFSLIKLPVKKFSKISRHCPFKMKGLIWRTLKSRIFKHAFYLQFSQTQLSGKEIFAPSSSFSESEPDVESASGPPFDRMPPSINVQLLKTSVADPTPDPDPHVFGPPGSRSGSISQRYGSGTGSIGQMHRSADPDPQETVMDTQHC